MLFVSSMVLWGLPRFSHYQEGLPYLYHLGGMALVAWYLGLGFLSLGLYRLVMGCLSFRLFQAKGLHEFLVGGVALILAGACVWLYLMLLEMSVTM
jgi:hypothetical protein